jgi:SAM-dependent methyltransferase
MSDGVFQHYSAYYDLLYRDKDYKSEAEYVARAVKDAGAAAKNLLEFGSGTGRHGRLLAQQGFAVFGVERSETMVAAARADSPTDSPYDGSFECMQGDIRTAQLNRLFDGVISLFHVGMGRRFSKSVLPYA